MNNRIFIKVALIVMLWLNIADAQPFYHVGTGTDGPILCLFADTGNNILYAGGQFAFAGNIQCNGIGKWNGFNWDSLKNDVVADARGLNMLNNEFYVGGGLGFFDTSLGQWKYSALIKWNAINQSWIKVDSPTANA